MGDIEKARNARGIRVRTRILVVDRNAHFRETIRRVLGYYPEFEVAGEAENLPEAIARIAEAEPDLVLLDLGLVSGGRLARLRELARSHPGVRMVVLVTEYSPPYRKAIQSMGRCLTVAKDRIEEDLALVIGAARS